MAKIKNLYVSLPLWCIIIPQQKFLCFETIYMVSIDMQNNLIEKVRARQL